MIRNNALTQNIGFSNEPSLVKSIENYNKDLQGQQWILITELNQNIQHTLASPFFRLEGEPLHKKENEIAITAKIMIRIFLCPFSVHRNRAENSKDSALLGMVSLL